MFQNSTLLVFYPFAIYGIDNGVGYDHARQVTNTYNA